MRNHLIPLAAALVLSVPLVACGGAGDDAETVTTSVATAALLPTAASGCDAPATAGAGWVSTAIPASNGSFSVTLRATPELAEGAWPPVVQAVVGLSDGAAGELGDLGVAVRFNESGGIDVRNGATFAADEPFPYRVQDGPYEFRFDVDVTAHTYSVWVRHLDGIEKPMTALATNYSFSDEQQSVTVLDTLNRHAGGASGGVTTCGFTHEAAAVGAPAAGGAIPRFALRRDLFPALVKTAVYRP